jgi:hypothetical protein
MTGRSHGAWKTCAWLSAYSLAACAGTETGNPSFEGRLAYDAYSSDPSVAALSVEDASEAAPLRVDSTWLVLGDVHFLAEGACDAAQDGAVHATGIGEGDHAESGHVSTALALPEGRYCGVRLPLERARSAVAANVPDALAEHSVLIEGTLADGTPLRLRSARQEPLVLRSEQPFRFSADAAAVVIGFDVATWLRDVDWSAAERADDGSIAIDVDHNRALFDVFDAALLEGTALFADPGESGAIDEAQRLASGAI